MVDPVKNFAKVTVSIPYDYTATSILLNTGDGAKLPNPTTDGYFNLVWWNSTDYPDPSDDSNKEIVRCTVNSSDTLTIIRSQEGTSATNKNVSGKIYRMALTFTAKMIPDLQTDAQSRVDTHAGLYTGVHGISIGSDASKSASPTVGQRYIAVDTQKDYECYIAGTWVDTTHITNLTQIPTRNHNDLQLRNTVATHPAESVGVLSPSSMFPQDIGKNWKSIPVGSIIVSLTYTGKGIIIAGTNAGSNAIYRSTDYGQTWSPGIPIGGTHAFTLTYAGNGIIVAGTGGAGNIYRSTDYGLTWSTGIPVSGSHIYALTYAGNGIVVAGDGNNGKIYRSTDYGLTWSTGVSVGTSIYGLIYIGNGVVIAGDLTNGKIYRSTNYGLTWGTGIPVGSQIFSLTYTGNGIVIIGDVNNGNIYRSTDYGLTWSAGISVGSAITSLTYAGNGIVIAGDNNNGNIYRSTDYGLTWSAGIPVGTNIYALIYTGNGIIIGGDNTTANIYRSDIPYSLEETMHEISAGLDANKSASPTVGQRYIAVDTQKDYECYITGTWRDITATHAALTTLVHNFDSSGNAPPQIHGTNKHDSTTVDGGAALPIGQLPIHGISAHTGTIGAWAQIDKTTSDIADIATKSHASLSDGIISGTTNSHGMIDTHISSYTAHGISIGQDASKSASPTIGQRYIAVDTQKDYECYIAGTWRDITTTHAALIASVHNFDSSGNAPPQTHGISAHTGTIGATSQVSEDTSLYYTDARARASISGTTPITYNSSTGAIGIYQAGSGSNGYLSSTDWTSFNNKQGSIGYTPVNKAGDTMSGPLTVNAQYASANYTTTTSVNWNYGNVQSMTLANGTNTFTFSNPISGGRYMLMLKQPGSGAAGTVSWPTVLWPSATAPVLTTTNNKTDVITFVYDGSNYYGNASFNY